MRGGAQGRAALGLPADIRVDKDPPFDDLPTGRR
jgi:hypothetical protein